MRQSIQARVRWADLLLASIAWLCAVGLCGCGFLINPSFDADLELSFNDREAISAESTAAITERPIFRSRPIFNSIPGKIGSHAATCISFADGELLAAWYSYDGPNELEGSAIFMSRLPVGSDDWQAPRLHVDRPVGDGNPVLYAESDRVWLFQAVVPLGWATSSIEFQVSEDRGHTWSEPVRLNGPLGANVRYPPVRTASGQLLLPAYSDWFGRSLFYHSDDGRNWRLGTSIPTDPPFLNVQPSLVRLPGGRILAILRNQGAGWLWVTASDDGGRTWAQSRDSGFVSPAAPGAIYRLNSDRLMLVYNNHPSRRRNLTAALSPDAGASWPFRRVLVDEDIAVMYPDVTQSPDGLIHVVYTHGRSYIGHLTFNEAWMVSGDPP